MIYQLIDEKRLDHTSVMVGLPLGLVFGLLELFLFPKYERRFREWSFTKMLVLKVLLYTAAIYLVSILLTVILNIPEGLEMSKLLAFLTSPTQLVLVIYTLVIYSLLVLFLQINRLMGEGTL